MVPAKVPVLVFKSIHEDPLLDTICTYKLIIFSHLFLALSCIPCHSPVKHYSHYCPLKFWQSQTITCVDWFTYLFIFVTMMLIIHALLKYANLVNAECDVFVVLSLPFYYVRLTIHTMQYAASVPLYCYYHCYTTGTAAGCAHDCSDQVSR